MGESVRKWVERVAILLALLSLWPWVLGWPHPGWRIVMYAMLGLMGLLFVVNFVRLWRLGHRKPPDDD